MFRSKLSHPDYFLLGIIFILTVFGLIILTSASSDLSKNKFNDSYYYLKHQLLYGLLLGAAGFVFCYFFNYSNFRKIAVFILGLNVILLVMVFTPFGVTIGGATRWLQFGSVTFQPSELLKITFIVYIAMLFGASRINRSSSFKNGLVPFAVTSGIVGGLLVIQPATSMVAILIGSALIMYVLSGAKWRYVFGLVGVGILCLSILVVATPYRRNRVMSFFQRNQAADNAGRDYHINQALIAIGSGGLSGVGYGQSSSKLGILPAAIDDSVFAVAAQELGFIGAGSLIVLFALLVLRMFWLAMKTRDNFGKLILAGFASVLALQSITNIGAISGLLPLTGVPLPFVSYGGTALAVFLTMSGIALNISKNR